MFDTKPELGVEYLQHISDLKTELKQLDQSAVYHEFHLIESSRLLKTTISVCEHCLGHVKAAVYEEQGQVWIKSCCVEHGLMTNLLENDARFYRLSNKDGCGQRFADDMEFYIPEFSSCCGPAQPKSQPCAVQDSQFANQLVNKSCTILIEVTNACNLACRVCYADASGDRILPFAAFKAYVARIAEEKSFIDSVQITGGEATIHPDFWAMVEWLHQQDYIGLIYLPTNGIELSKSLVAKRLVPFRKKLLVLLQFDGEHEDTNQSLRRANTLKNREAVIQLLAKHKICMQLTMTVAHQLSEKEVAWVMQQGLKHKHIRLIGLLPTFYTGRYQLPHTGKQRPTLSTVVHAIVKGIPEKIKTNDFMPIPCSHPNCGWTSLFARRFGLLFNITQKIDMETVMNEVAYKTTLKQGEIQSALQNKKQPWYIRVLTAMVKKLIRPKDVFGIAIKPFMDAYSYDQDRVQNCCHHILDTQGNLVSFCEYNTRLRAGDSWDSKPSITGPHKKVALAIKQKMDD
jgi:uncharacterized radical SAM superfamily Fe-S cluster-containing enzyme